MPLSLLSEVVAKGAFLSKVRLPIYDIVNAVILSKKHQRSTKEAEQEGVKNGGRHHLVLVHK